MFNCSEHFHYSLPLLRPLISDPGRISWWSGIIECWCTAAVIPGPASGLIIGGNNSIIIIVMIIANNDYPNIALSLLLLSCYKTCERPNYRKPLCLKGIIVSLKLISDIAYYYGCQVSSVIPNSENGLIIALPAFMVSLNRPTAL